MSRSFLLRTLIDMRNIGLVIGSLAIVLAFILSMDRKAEVKRTAFRWYVVLIPWIEEVVGKFNKLCESMKIDGTNSTGAKDYIDKLRTLKK